MASFCEALLSRFSAFLFSHLEEAQNAAKAFCRINRYQYGKCPGTGPRFDLELNHMSANRILIVDATPWSMEEFKQALGPEWELMHVSSGTEALELLKKQPFDILVVSLLSGLDEPRELLNQARKNYPRTLRFGLAAEANRERVMLQLPGMHQTLTVPLDIPTLRTTIERALVVNRPQIGGAPLLPTRTVSVQVPVPAPVPVTASSSSSSRPHPPKERTWLLAAAAVLLLVVVCWKFGFLMPQPQAAQARTPGDVQPSAPTEVSRAPAKVAVETQTVAPQAVKNAATLHHQLTGSNVSTTLNDQKNDLAPPVAPVQLPLQDLKLQGIISSARPSAIINGRMLWLNESLDGAKLVEIGRTNVVVEENGQRRKLNLEVK
jgi:CheY-like chemotaxis protein